MNHHPPDLSALRPPGGKRSSKRDRILNVFLRQKGHLSADDLCDLVHREDAGIGRATVYRTLQWMVEAGVARKVDFGEGRSRFEPSYGHPRHFHLICNTCHRSSEFLSSDIEALVEEISAARKFAPSQTVVQIFGTCEECRTGAGRAKGNTIDGATTERVSHCVFKRYGERFEDSRGKQIFLEFADEERAHLDLLIHEYRTLTGRPEPRRRRTGGAAARSAR